jgi:hypothetical protein
MIYLFIFAVLWWDPGALCILGKHSTSNYIPTPGAPVCALPVVWPEPASVSLSSALMWYLSPQSLFSASLARPASSEPWCADFSPPDMSPYSPAFHSGACSYVTSSERPLGLSLTPPPALFCLATLLLLLFCGTGVWTQGLTLQGSIYTIYVTAPVLCAFSVFQIGSGVFGWAGITPWLSYIWFLSSWDYKHVSPHPTYFWERVSLAFCPGY